MVNRILREIDKTCQECTQECSMYGCVLYRIKSHIIDNTINVEDINIDEFFADENGEQIGMDIE